MNIKKFICNFFKFKYDSSLRNQLIECRIINMGLFADRKKLLEVMSKSKIEISSMRDEVTKFSASIKQLVSEKHTLQSIINDLNELLSAENRMQYTGKLTSAKIEYRRQLLSAGNTLKTHQIDIRNFITPNNHWIYDSIKKKGLFINSENEINKKVPALYKLARKGYKYISDKKQFGKPEVWLFPFEAVKLKAKDCEDWSNIIGSYFACAGVPRSRWWVTCGRTRTGTGHATIYARDDTGKWRHLNSTNQKVTGLKLTDYPLNTDKKDLIGLETYWFSYNDFFSVTMFEDLQTNGFYKSELKDKIVMED